MTGWAYFTSVLLLCSVSAAFGQSAGPRLNADAVDRVANDFQIPANQIERRIEPVRPRRGNAFLAEDAQVMPAIRHTLTIDKRALGSPVLSYLDRDGRVVRQESTATVADPRRMTLDVQTLGTKNSGRRIVARGTGMDKRTLDSIWSVIARRIPVESIDEFELINVIFDFGDGEPPRPALIFHIWGPDNPLGMPEDLPESAKNRIRIIYDIERGEISADNLL